MPTYVKFPFEVDEVVSDINGEKTKIIGMEFIDGRRVGEHGIYHECMVIYTDRGVKLANELRKIKDADEQRDEKQRSLFA